MKEKNLVEKTAIIGRSDYVVPYTESYVVEITPLLGISPLGDHEQALFGDDGSDHERANIVGSATTSNGAKAVILGQEFSFSDLWEE